MNVSHIWYSASDWTTRGGCGGGRYFLKTGLSFFSWGEPVAGAIQTAVAITMSAASVHATRRDGREGREGRRPGNQIGFHSYLRASIGSRFDAFHAG